MNNRLEKPVVYDTVDNYTCNKDSGNKYSPLLCLSSSLPWTVKPKYLRDQSKYESILWHFKAREGKSKYSKSC